MFKLYIHGPHVYGGWLTELLNIPRVSTPEEADIIMLTGGEDVTPNWYGRTPHKFTTFDEDRDRDDFEVFNKALKGGKKLIGICRGSQFLTVMAGGQLVQDVNRHALTGTHDIHWFDGTTTKITSTHHQMHYPYEMKPDEYRVLAWASCLSDRYMMDDVIDYREAFKAQDYREPEVTFYPKINSLAIQGHPEHLDHYHSGVVKMSKVVEAFLNDKLL
jgi:hypothetical protein